MSTLINCGIWVDDDACTARLGGETWTGTAEEYHWFRVLIGSALEQPEAANILGMTLKRDYKW